MTDAEWQDELSAALRDSGWAVFSAGCAPDSSTCFARLTNGHTGAARQVTLSRNRFRTREERCEEVRRQISVSK